MDKWIAERVSRESKQRENSEGLKKKRERKEVIRVRPNVEMCPGELDLRRTIYRGSVSIWQCSIGFPSFKSIPIEE